MKKIVIALSTILVVMSLMMVYAFSKHRRIIQKHKPFGTRLP
ncbi:MAG: hypothetical protein R2759_04555 [Bacteroidales bacterium]